MKIISTGKSLNELYKEYGIGSNGFYSHWWKSESFAMDKPEPGEYEINLEKKALVNLTFEEQKGKLKKGYDVPHPAIVAQALLEYHKKTGKYLMKDWTSRTTLLASGGHRVNVGDCDAGGVGVGSWVGGVRDDDVGMSASRKIKSFEIGSLDPIEDLSLEARVKRLEEKFEWYDNRESRRENKKKSK